MSRLSTHVLDTSIGRPAANIAVRLFAGEREIASAVTDGDGRCASLLPPDKPIAAGIYRLVFETGSYFSAGFYPEVAVSFTVWDESANYHVPLLISPFGFTTYRGS